MTDTTSSIVDPLATLTPEEAAEFDRILAALHERGWRDIAEHGHLRVGARIRHVGHQWAGAYIEGTGYVIALTERPRSSWSQSYGGPDIELVTLSDQNYGLGASRLSQVADYHVQFVEEAASR